MDEEINPFRVFLEVKRARSAGTLFSVGHCLHEFTAFYGIVHTGVQKVSDLMIRGELGENLWI